MSEWSDFLVAEVGASAALLGLLFVALSLNLSKILAERGLPERAMQSLTQLLSVLLVCSLLLMPAQQARSRGLEILFTATAFGLAGTVLALRALGMSPQHRIAYLWNLVLLEVSLLPWFVGGVQVWAGGESGAYWIAVGVCLSIVKAIFDAWVFLVEVNR